MTPADYATLRLHVKQSEGLRLKPYTDTVGRLSVGYGRNLTDVGISQIEAEMLLDHDLTRAIVDVQAVCPEFNELDPVRQVVLAEMCFNLGAGRLAGFVKMLAAVEAKDYATAAAEMRNSRWFHQVGARGVRLADAMETGAVQ